MDKPIKSVGLSSELPSRMGTVGRGWINNRAKYDAEVKRVANVLKNWKNRD